MSRPLIGITLDFQEKGSFSARPHYALRTHYFDAIQKAGGVPFAIPYCYEMMAEYVDKCDGFLTPGGECASPLEWYVEEERQKGSPHAPSPRVKFELELTQRFLDADKSVLGICQGMQQLGGMHGFKMTGDVHKYLNTDIQHGLNGRSPTDYAYDVTIEKGTFLYDIIGKDSLPVNTAHREALVLPSEKGIVSAKSADGCIQAIELTDYKFALGVQWHPEYFIDSEETGHLYIFKYFVNTV